LQLKCHFCRTALEDEKGEYASWIETVRVEPGRRTEVRSLFCLTCFDVTYGRLEDLLRPSPTMEELECVTL